LTPLAVGAHTYRGTNNTVYRGAPSIPGVTTKVSDGTTAPSSNEVTAGLTRGLHQNLGTLRVDYVFRTYADIYGSFVDLATGTVADPTGRTYNKEIVKNTPDATRWYHAMTVAGDYRFSRVSLGGNCTFSYSKGNNDGENVGSGPIMSAINTYPEYKRESWSWPTGYMGNDQRHKMCLYASWLLPVSETFGQMTVGVIQRADTGLPYDIAFTVNPTAYITNPGYVSPPTSLTYYIDNRGPLRTDNVYATDLSFVWTKKLKGSFEVFFRGLVYSIFNNQAVGRPPRAATRFRDRRTSRWGSASSRRARGGRGSGLPDRRPPHSQVRDESVLLLAGLGCEADLVGFLHRRPGEDILELRHLLLIEAAVLARRHVGPVDTRAYMRRLLNSIARVQLGRVAAGGLRARRSRGWRVIAKLPERLAFGGDCRPKCARGQAGLLNRLLAAGWRPAGVRGCRPCSRAGEPNPLPQSAVLYSPRFHMPLPSGVRRSAIIGPSFLALDEVSR